MGQGGLQMTDASAVETPSAAATASTPAASVIIPLRASPALFQWQERLTRILATIPAHLFEIVIVDYGTRGDSRFELQSTVRDAGSSARLLRVDCENQPFSIGRARDLGVMAAAAPVVLFNDIDFLAPRSTYQAIAMEIGRRALVSAFDRFFCVPVIFLSETATRDYMAAERLAEFPLHHAAFRLRALDPSSGVSVSIAYASSCMVANRLHYLAIGGHDEAFFGHGAEDFEFLHRLASTVPKAPRPSAYYVDFKDNGITAYRGFRAAFALYGIEAFQVGLFLVHLHHPSRPSRDYNRRRKRNFRLLRRRMERFDRTGTHPAPLPDPGQGRTLVLLEQGSTEFEALRFALPLLGTLIFMNASKWEQPEEILKAFRDEDIDRVLIADPRASPERMRAYRAVQAADVPFLAFGEGALPRSWFFDPSGFEADSRTYDRENWDQPLPVKAHAATRQYIADLRAGRGLRDSNKARAGPEVARLVLGLLGREKVLFVALRGAGTLPQVANGELDQAGSRFLRQLLELGPELKRRGWRIVCSNSSSAGADRSAPDIVYAPDSMHLLDLIESADVVLSFGSAPGLVAAALSKPVLMASEKTFGHSGIAAVADRVEDVLEYLSAPSGPDTETVVRLIHYLRNKAYSFGDLQPAPKRGSGRRAPLQAAIDFREIRGVTVTPVFLQRSARLLPLDSPVFHSFGGQQAVERAIRLATLQAASADAEHSAPRSWTKWLALQTYRLTFGWRLPRRERILLRHAPEEVLARTGDKHARRLLRFLAPDDLSP